MADARPAAVALPVYYFVSFAAFGCYLPFFPRWLEGRGVVGARMSMVVALIPAMSIVAPPFFGWISDRMRVRGSLLRWVSAGAALAFAALTAAAIEGAPPFVALVVTVAAYSLCRSPMTLIADLLALEKETARGAYGQRRLWGSVGFLLAAVGAGHYVDLEHAWMLPATLAVGYGLAFFAALALPKVAAPLPRPLTPYVGVMLRRPAIVLFLATALLSQAAHSGYDVCFSLHLRDLGASDGLAGAAWALGVVAEVVLMAFAPALLRRVRPIALLGIGLGGAALRWGLLAVVTDTRILLALQPMHALSFAVVWIAAIAHIKDSAIPERLGTLQGMFQASLAIGSVLGMLAAGPVYARAAGGVVFAVSAGLALLGLSVWIALRHHVRTEVREPATS